MKKDIHPTYFAKAKTTCVCGAHFTVGSTKENIDIEICSQCHPFFTGNEKVLDIAGRVDRFKKRAEAGKTAVKTKAKK